MTNATFVISPQLACGTVSLIVADLPRSLLYYTQNIGLSENRRAGSSVWLGAGGADLLQLTEQPGARPVQRGRTGLYHFALLTPSRPALGRTLRHLLETRTPIDGASDHGVSEALYLSDPDGHGIEIYRDRRRSEWPFVGGRLAMVTDPMDAEGVLAAGDSEPEPWTGIDPGTKMGHVHLHVADLAAAEQFYVGILGFELMQHFGSQAAFVSAGGYHHHLGLNTWAGRGAPPPPSDAARLDSFELRLPDAAALEAVIERLRAAGAPLTGAEGCWRTADPSQNQVVITAA